MWGHVGQLQNQVRRLARSLNRSADAVDELKELVGLILRGHHLRPHNSCVNCIRSNDLQRKHGIS